MEVGVWDGNNLLTISLTLILVKQNLNKFSDFLLRKWYIVFLPICRHFFLDLSTICFWISRQFFFDLSTEIFGFVDIFLDLSTTFFGFVDGNFWICRQFVWICQQFFLVLSTIFFRFILILYLSEIMILSVQQLTTLLPMKSLL